MINQLQAKVVIMSFSNEGYLERAELEAMLADRGDVTVLEHDYKRYVGHKSASTTRKVAK